MPGASIMEGHKVALQAVPAASVAGVVTYVSLVNPRSLLIHNRPNQCQPHRDQPDITRARVGSTSKCRQWQNGPLSAPPALQVMQSMLAAFNQLLLCSSRHGNTRQAGSKNKRLLSRGCSGQYHTVGAPFGLSL